MSICALVSTLESSESHSADEETREAERDPDRTNTSSAQHAEGDIEFRNGGRADGQSRETRDVTPLTRSDVGRLIVMTTRREATMTGRGRMSDELN